jgi:hypothetical protein
MTAVRDVPGTARCAHCPRVRALAPSLCAADAHLVDDDRRWSTAVRAPVGGDVVSVPATAISGNVALRWSGISGIKADTPVASGSRDAG